MKKSIFFAIMVCIILFFAILNKNNDDLYGTYYGEGTFGSIKIVVVKGERLLDYYFDFTEESKQNIYKTKKFSLTFIGKKRSNPGWFISNETLYEDLPTHGVMYMDRKDYFEKLEIKIGDKVEIVNLNKID